MYSIKWLIKKDIKRLLQMPLIFIIGIIFPFITTFILNLNGIAEPDAQEPTHNMTVYCLDASDSFKVKEMIGRLEKNRGVNLRYEQVKGLSLTEAEVRLKEEIQQYSLQICLFFPEDYAQRLIEGRQALYIYDAGYDDRVSYLLNELALFMQDRNPINDVDETSYFVDLGGEVYSQVHKGYSFSIHMFIGAISVIFALGNFIVLELWRGNEERTIYNRFLLAGIKPYLYDIAKISVLILFLAMQCFSIALALKIGVHIQLEVSWSILVGILFFLGIQMICYSLMIENICTQHSMANYIGVLLIGMQNILAGMYFPFNPTLLWQEKIAFLFPQYWVAYTLRAFRQGKEMSIMLYVIFMVSLSLFQILVAYRFREKR